MNKIVFIVCFSMGFGAHAALDADTPEDNNEMVFSSDDIKTQLNVIDRRIDELNKEVRKRAEIFNNLQQGAGGPAFVWEAESNVPEKRRRLSKLVKIGLKDVIHQIDTLEEQREDLESELEWVEIQVEAEKDQAQKKKAELEAQAERQHFHCQDLPVSAEPGRSVRLQQDFGRHLDKETGIVWKSAGWWLSQMGGPIRACASGVVAYVGKVTGRGRVLLIDHGAGHMTLYANLNDDSESKLYRGAKVNVGAILGTPREKFYFEVRSGGQAINPRQVLAGESLAKLGL